MAVSSQQADDLGSMVLLTPQFRYERKEEGWDLDYSDPHWKTKDEPCVRIRPYTIP